MSNIDDPRVEAYLRAKYADVFSEEAIRGHLKDYVGRGYASQMIQWVLQEYPGADKILDVGSGFGSFVLLCRENGIEAVGMELSDFEVYFARDRLRQQRPQDDPEQVYIHGDALHMPFPDQSFDVVTLFNVLEHVDDTKNLISEVNRVLRPRGHLFSVSPNYSAFRREAHYHIPWIPWLPRSFAKCYIRLFGKNPQFFEESIFYTTHLGILRTLGKAGFLIYPVAYDGYKPKLANPDTIKNGTIRMIVALCKRYHMLWLISLAIQTTILKKKLIFFNPFKDSTVVHAVKNKGE